MSQRSSAGTTESEVSRERRADRSQLTERRGHRQADARRPLRRARARDRRGHGDPARAGLVGRRTLGDALVEGMRIVGIDFRDGILFVPEVLLAANAMKAGMEILRPLLSESDAERMGKVVIGA